MKNKVRSIRHICFETTTPAGHDVRIHGDPHMSAETLAALHHMMDLAIEHYTKEKRVAIKIFQLNDSDWFAAETLEQAIDCAKREFDYSDEQIEDPFELDEADLDRLLFTQTDEQDRKIATVSFRAELQRRIDAGDEFPYMFATSEY